ncbi:MAG: hypothetical protein ABR536_00330, partial [Solirubrobacterales bacterium]
MSPLIAAANAASGGAALDQVIGLTVAVSLGFGALVVLGNRHRAGRRTPLGALAAFSERVSGMPGWAALPLAIAGIALVGAVFGYMWDVAWHIERGRDDGPLANPSHYFILAGLYGIVAAGYLTTVLPRLGEMPGRSAIRIAPGWKVPLGGVLILAAGLFAFAGFPLDDLWHRMFGQDVTLWGPTHLIMLGGGMMTLIGIALLFEEGVACSRRREGDRRDPSRRPARTRLARLAEALPAIPLWPSRALIAGGILAGLSIFQGEFDYGVPQFELVLQPLLIAAAAGVSLVCARIWIGRGGALGAVAFYLLIRGVLALLVGPLFGFTTPAMPLYAPEAVCVELAALALGPRALALGAVGGLAIGTLGFAGEWPWVNAVMPIDWNGSLLPEGLLLAAVGGLAGGLIGSLLGLGLRRELPTPRLAGSLAGGSLAALMACFAFGLADHTPSGASAHLTLSEAAPAPKRQVNATVRFDPPQLTDGANWVRGIAWQGGGLVGFQLQKIGEGVYRTPSPLPVYGDWKVGLRVQNGHSVIGVPIYEPADKAIPAGEVPASSNFTRPIQPDRRLLQRERKPDVPGWLWLAASLVVLAAVLCFLALL